MMRSLFSGVSGLKNHQTRMDVIGNNISNVNTTGFKSSRVNFTDMLSQTLSGASTPQDNVGGTNPKQIGLGSAVGAIDMLFTNGSVQSTGVNTDLALSSANALFVVSRSGKGNYVYTRNGDFQFDANGNYVQAGNGYFVQGWSRDPDTGEINTGKDPDIINIPAGKMMDPKMTTKVNFSSNLDAATALNGQCVVTTTVYSALGDPVTVSMIAKKTKVAQDDDGHSYSEWQLSLQSATVKMSDGSTKNVDITASPMKAKPVTLTFDGNGKLTGVAYTDGTSKTSKDSAEKQIILQYATDTATTTTTGAYQLQKIDLNFKEITQYTTGTGSTVAANRDDGNASGTLQSISIDKTGVITGTYTNGEKQAEAQVALARFNNPGGLTKVGESLYEESNNSGERNFNTATAFGATITPSALEMSNVDVANEFTDMIITQRGFQGNSKIITVSDEMLETLINMKR